MEFDHVEALSFDCYGTLIDWEAGLAAELGRWARAHGLDRTDEELLAGYSRYEAQVEADEPGEPYPAVLARSLHLLGAELGVPVSDEEADALAHSVPQWPAFPDSAQALRRLATRFSLIIVSNVDRASFAGSNQRLGAQFTSIITAEDVGAYKPSPRPFEALLAETKRLGVPPGGLLHVAQSLFHDHEPAQAFGLPTVWINRRRGREGWGATPPPRTGIRPTHEFGSMAEFADAAVPPTQ